MNCPKCHKNGIQEPLIDEEGAVSYKDRDVEMEDKGIVVTKVSIEKMSDPSVGSPLVFANCEIKHLYQCLVCGNIEIQ